MLRNTIFKKIVALLLFFSMIMTSKISNNLLVIFSMSNLTTEESVEVSENGETSENEEVSEFYEVVEDEIIEEEENYGNKENEKETKIEKEIEKGTNEVDEEVEEIFDDEYTNYGEEKESEEETIDFQEYKELSVLEQLLYNKKDSAELDEDVINIKDDIVLYYPIYVKDDVSININDKKITSPVIESAFIVTGSITLYGDDGLIESQNFKYPVFDLLNGEMTVEGGNIKGAYIGGTAVRANDSTITINGGSIIGGDGEDFYDDVGGDGGCAITATFSSDDNKIVFNGGSVIGGRGGVGYNGAEESYGGYAFFDGEFLYEDEELYIRGSRNEIGGGNGGLGIYVTSKNDSSNVIINKEGVKGGDGGHANRKVKKEVRYGKTFPSKFDLRKYEDNGVERSVVTSLHDQFQTGLCNTFSTVASAESYLLRYHPEYVEELGYNPNLTYTKNFPSEQREKVTVGSKEVTLGTDGYYDNELKLSEAYLAYALRYHPQDPLGYAKQSKAVPTKPGKRYFNIGSSAMEMINFLAPFRGIPSGQDLNGIMLNTINNLVVSQAEDVDDDGIEEGDGITEKTDHVYEEDDSVPIAHLSEAVILKSAKYVKYTDCSSKEEFLRGIKEAIYNNCAVVLGGNFVYGGGCSAYERPEGGEHNVYMYMDSESGGGHAVSVVGWDDNFPVSKFVEAKSKFAYSSEAEKNKKPTNNGALIIKQSTYGPMWTYIYYDSIFGSSWHYQVFDWELPDTYYENVYYYDGGTSANKVQPLGYTYDSKQYISSPCVLFQLNYVGQVIKAVSFVSNDNVNIENDSQKPRLQIFKAELGSSLNKIGDYIVDIPINLHKGLNFIELPKLIRIERQGMQIPTYVCSINFSNCPGKDYGALIDYCKEDENWTISNDVKFISGLSGNSYLYREHNGSYSKYTNGNFRIKMITSSEREVTFDANGGSFGDKNSITLLRLYGDKVLNEEVTKPTYGTREFLGFSTDKDATEPNIDSDTIFKSKNPVTYYAIYEKEEETTPEETTLEETTPEETTPEETTREETTPEETTPEETTPEETSPTETTPEETSPTETTPEETSPTETTPEETTTKKPTETTKKTNNDGSSRTGGSKDETDIISPVAPEDLNKNQNVTVTKIENNLTIEVSQVSDIMVWNYDVNKKNWGLQVVGKNGEIHSIKNTLYIDSSSALKNKNNIPDVYLFDENGQLSKGFVDYKDGNRYYFEENDSVNIGKMVRNQWKEIGKGKWYYFDVNGIMKRNTTTPDGYYVNEEGVYVEKNRANINSIYTDKTNKTNKSNIIITIS